MLKEFKEFAMKGNVLDMAVGIVIGAAFGLIIASLVADVIMPPVGFLLGNVDFANIFYSPQRRKGGRAVRDPGRGQSSRRRHYKLGHLHQHHHQFRHRRVRYFSPREGRQHYAQGEGSASAEATTKECPYCLSAIPLKATRCPHCTSEVTAAA